MISDGGVLFSSSFKGNRFIKPDKSGRYDRVTLSKNNVTFRRPTHHLVLEAFVGLRPKGYYGCHNNGNSRDNKASNLRWDSPKNNQADRVKHGTSNRGEGAWQTHLTEGDVKNIRKELNKGVKGVILSKRYNVSTNCISRIKKYRTWQ